MKTLRNSDAVFHAWPNNLHPSALCGNVWYEGDKFYSYRAVIGHRVVSPNGTYFFLSDRHYSPTTSRHQATLRQACRNHGTLVYCHAPQDFVCSRDAFTTEYNDAFLKAATANNRNRGKWFEACNSIHARLTEFIVHWNAAHGTAYPIPEIRGLTPAELEAAKAHAYMEKKKREEARAEREKAYAKQAAVNLAAWRTHDRQHLNSGTTHLRLSADGKRIETSMGAVIPVSSAKRLWALITATIASGVRYSTARKVGAYTLNFISPSGDIQVGCHDIAYAELELMARTLSLIGREA